jgi:hypothetical protein
MDDDGVNQEFLLIWSLNKYGDSHESAVAQDFLFLTNRSPVLANLASRGYPGRPGLSLRVGTWPFLRIVCPNLFSRVIVFQTRPLRPSIGGSAGSEQEMVFELPKD